MMKGKANEAHTVSLITFGETVIWRWPNDLFKVETRGGINKKWWSKLQLLTGRSGGLTVSQMDPSEVEPVGVEDEWVQHENQDDGEGQDKHKTDEGDKTQKETGESGGGRRGLLHHIMMNLYVST
jgi:hypothetical protein